MDKKFYNRGYYGTVSHNSKAQYQMYFGWYDGNPANLNPLPPVELPANKEAKQLLADTYSQLGYQAESVSPQRNRKSLSIQIKNLSDNSPSYFRHWVHPLVSFPLSLLLW